MKFQVPRFHSTDFWSPADCSPGAAAHCWPQISELANKNAPRRQFSASTKSHNFEITSISLYPILAVVLSGSFFATTLRYADVTAVICGSTIRGSGWFVGARNRELKLGHWNSNELNTAHLCRSVISCPFLAESVIGILRFVWGWLTYRLRGFCGAWRGDGLGGMDVRRLRKIGISEILSFPLVLVNIRRGWKEVVSGNAIQKERKSRTGRLMSSFIILIAVSVDVAPNFAPISANSSDWTDT